MNFSKAATTTFLISLLGSVAIGVPLRDPFVIGGAEFALGAVAAFLVGSLRLAGNRTGSIGGLVLGILLSFPVLVAIEFLTPIRTFVNTEPGDIGMLIGFLPLVAIIYVVWAGASVLAFWLTSRFVPRPPG